MRDSYEMNNNAYSDDSAIDIDRIFGTFLRKLWVILLVAILFGSGLYCYAKLTYVKEYISRTTLSFTTTTYVTTTDDTGKQIGVVAQKKPYSAKDVDRYQFLLKSDAMVDKIYNALGKNYSKSDIENSLAVTGALNNENITITGIFVVNVVSRDKQFCEDAINVILDTFPDYLKSFDTSLGIDVIKGAKPPTVNNKDNAAKKAFYGFIIGAALVAVLIFISEILRDTVRQIDDIRSKTRTKALGSIPTIEGPKKLWHKNKQQENVLLLTDKDRVSFSFIESFKAIRTKIENVAAEKDYKIFAVTSTFENEGKTTVAINLACALAQKGKSVLLIDCDLRKPSVLRMINMKEDGKSGLIQIIKDKATYRESIKYIKQLGIFVLSSGGVSPKSTEVLDTEKVRELLEVSGKEFDYVIIDTPPAHVVADCLVIAPLVDAMIFTIKKDYAKISDINDTIDEIAATDIDIIGSVLTMSNEEGSNRYFSHKGSLYYYRHRRGYYKYNTPYGYESSEEKK